MRSDALRRPHVARPRRDTIALTIPKNAIWLGSAAAAGVGLLLFLVGMWIGRGSAEAPAPIMEQALADRPAAAEEIIEQSPEDVEPSEEIVPPPDRPRAKLEIRERMPRGKHGMQVGAFASKTEARGFLDHHAAEFSGMPIYLLPAKGSRGVRYRVRVGAFDEREAAEKARDALSPDLAKGSMVVKY